MPSRARRLPPEPIALLVALAALACGGCAGPSPRVTVETAVTGERTSEALAVDGAIELENPSEVPVEVQWLTYRFEVDGKTVYEGRRAAAATLAASSTTRAVLPAVIRFDETGWDPSSVPSSVPWRISGRLHYVAPGRLAEILYDIHLSRPSAWFEGEGRLGAPAPSGG